MEDADAPPSTECEGKYVRVVKRGRWEYVSRTGTQRAVVVLAEHHGKIILVEQYRVPVQARTLELPAGIYGDDESGEHETPEQCALRELEEETGFRGARAEVLLTGPVAPGLTTELMYLVRVDGLRRVHAGGGVGGEDITVHTVPLDRAAAWLEERRRAGLQVEPRIYAGLYFLGRN